MNIKNAKTIVLIAIASLTVAFPLFMLKQSTANPSSGAVLYVYPEKIEDPTLVPGSTFWINVTIYNVTSMHICQFNLSFSPAILGIGAAMSLPVNGKYPAQNITASGAKGYVHVELAYDPSVTLPETQAPLFTIKFTVKDYGYTPLDLHDTSLKDSNDNPIPHETQDGSVRILKHDVAVEGVSTSVNETYVGRSLSIEVTVKNEGNTAENFTVSVYANGNLLGTSDVKDLAANETRKLTFSWNTTGFTPSMTPYTIKAQASVVPYEKNTANNVYIDGQVKIKIVGDVNGDGKVDIDDLYLWDAALKKSESGDPNWNPQADINGDGIVDKADGHLIIDNYLNEV